MDGTEHRLHRLLQLTHQIKWLLGIGSALILALSLVVVYWTWQLYARLVQ